MTAEDQTGRATEPAAVRQPDEPVIAFVPGPVRRPVALLVALPAPAQVLVGAACLALIGLLHRVAGPELAFSLFYLLPVAVVGLLANASTSSLFAALTAVVWAVADASAGTYSSPLVPVWNLLVRLGVLLVFVGLFGTAKSVVRAYQLARTDALTGVANLRELHDVAERELAAARRHARPVSILYLDLDGFKRVNDELGHGAGDALLRTVAEWLMEHVRTTDLVARVGGDEFAVLLPETGAEEARDLAERLQTDAAAWDGVTASIGVATAASPPTSLDALLARADRSMYEAKRRGRGTVVHEALLSGTDRG